MRVVYLAEGVKVGEGLQGEVTGLALINGCPKGGDVDKAGQERSQDGKALGVLALGEESQGDPTRKALGQAEGSGT